MNVLPLDRQIAVVSALVEGMSIRSVERLTNTHRDTVMRLGVRIGNACARLHDRTVRDVRPSTIQLDELWAFIGKKQRRVTQKDAPEKGDCYTFIAMDKNAKAILSYWSGKRTSESTHFFLGDLRSRVLGAPVIFSDGFNAYPDAIDWAFGHQCHYGQVVKKFRGEPAVDAARRYSPGYVVGIERRVVRGRPNPRAICTSHIERQNLNVRMQSRRFTRLTNGFSKKIENHAAAFSLLVAHHNFCRVHETLKTTPAVEIGLTDHEWSIAELIEAATSESNGRLPGRITGPFRVIEGGKIDD